MALRILFLGDIFASTGRLLVERRLSGLIGREGLDLCLANGENAAGGVGLTAQTAGELFDSGLEALSGGNHTFKYKDLVPLLNNDPRLIRPANYPDPCPGKGWTILETAGGVKVGFGNIIGRVFMGPAFDCPFKAADRMLEKMREAGAQITIIDFHAEATSEKMAMAWHLDGRLGALLGTHTHVQTADAFIWPKGLAYISDVGMTGPHLSVIGMRPEETIATLATGRIHRFSPAKGRPILQGVILDFDDGFKAAAIT
ncbi:MAG: YmdB family metallophosphoesterase, partial [Deltaproteobacteria bacterium]|nr:YmdB family metallophosphoesterase [Deltaproteobacteria bacterium]